MPAHARVKPVLPVSVIAGAGAADHHDGPGAVVLARRADDHVGVAVGVEVVGVDGEPERVAGLVVAGDGVAAPA